MQELMEQKDYLSKISRSWLKRSKPAAKVQYGSADGDLIKKEREDHDVQM